MTGIFFKFTDSEVLPSGQDEVRREEVNEEEEGGIGYFLEPQISDNQLNISCGILFNLDY